MEEPRTPPYPLMRSPECSRSQTCSKPGHRSRTPIVMIGTRVLLVALFGLFCMPSTSAFSPLLHRNGLYGCRAAAAPAKVDIAALRQTPRQDPRAHIVQMLGSRGMRREGRSKVTPLASGVSVTLDRPAIPRLYGPLHVRVFLGLLLVLFFMTAAKNTSPAGIVVAIADGFKDFCHKNNIVFYDKLMYRLKLFRGKVQSWRDGFGRFWRRRFPIQVDVIQDKAYPIPCVLEERTSLGGQFVKFRFQFPGPSQAMDMDLGQQISIIGSTPEERVMKANFVPLSERYSPGYFEIVSEKNSVDDPSARILDTLALGEGIQVTPGPRLVNRHPGPINKLLLVISKLGVVPALQFLKALLPPSGYSVDYANVVWVNEKQDQYILSEEMQELFYKYNSKIDVDTVAERDLFMSNLAENPIFRAAIPAPTSDTLAIVAGPEFFVQKAVEYLRNEGYPEEIILVL